MELEFHTPATYRIRVKGHLKDSWSDRLGGMAIDVTEQAEGAREITLVGQLADQAALLGVLNTIYGLHLPLLSVEYVGNT
jgi:hypothetical protein